jgi:hypothetical protein
MIRSVADLSRIAFEIRQASSASEQREYCNGA